MALPNAKTPTTWAGPGRTPVALMLAVAGAITAAIVAVVGAGFSAPTGYALARAQQAPASFAHARKPVEVAIIPAVVDVIGLREEQAASERTSRIPG